MVTLSPSNNHDRPPRPVHQAADVAGDAVPVRGAPAGARADGGRADTGKQITDEIGETMNVCTWKIYDNESAQWDTSCGRRHNMGRHCTPVENGFKTCPYCGKQIKQNTVGYIPNYDHYNGSHRRLAAKYGT